MCSGRVGNMGGNVRLLGGRLDVDPGVGRVHVLGDHPAENVVGDIGHQVNGLVVHQVNLVAHVGPGDGRVKGHQKQSVAPVFRGFVARRSGAVINLLGGHARENAGSGVRPRDDVSGSVEHDQGAAINFNGLVGRVLTQQTFFPPGVSVF